MEIEFQGLLAQPSRKLPIPGKVLKNIFNNRKFGVFDRGVQYTIQAYTDYRKKKQLHVHILNYCYINSIVNLTNNFTNLKKL